MAQSSFAESDTPVEFLYLDRSRVASYIGQLSDKGVLTGLKSVLSKTTNHEGHAKASIAIANVEGKRSRSSSESAEETYDPFWTHAYTFLRDLELNFAVPVPNARIGSLVKFDSLVQFLDLRMMRRLWDPIAQSVLRAAKAPVSGATQGKKQRQQQQAQASSEIKLGLEVLKEMPHLLHMTFLAFSDDTHFQFWAAMNPEYLTISSEDLTMKFGAIIDGMWTVVGIVDGRIGESPKTLPVTPVLDPIINAMSTVREAIGRPKTHWGITPIAIYAPIHGLAESEVESAIESMDQGFSDSPEDQPS